MSELSKLVTHLRENPDARSSSVEDLGRRFGLSPDMVALAIKSLPQNEVSRLQKPVTRPTKETTKRRHPTWQRILDAPVEKGLPWVAIGLAAIIGMAQLAPSSLRTVLPLLAPLMGLGAAIFASWVKPLPRTGFWYSLLAPSACALSIALGVPYPYAVGVMLMGAAFYWVISILILVPVILWSSWRQISSQSKSPDRMTRQEMLDRLLDIRGSLQSSTFGAQKEPEPAGLAGIFSRLNLLLVAPAGFFSSAVLLYFYGVADPKGQAFGQDGMVYADQNLILAFTFVWLGTTALVFGMQFLFGWNSRTWYSTVFASLLFQAGSFAASYLPLGPSPMVAFSRQPSAFLLGVPTTLIVLFVGFGAKKLSARALENRRRQQNDPQVLMAEMVDLEYRLRPQAVGVTVLAVDVVGSTKMKGNADPYEAEWSFREYQNTVAVACAAQGGEVISTAGDGAILSFGSPSLAYDAALAIDRAVKEFNTTENRLDSPFTLRMGMHTGEVMGNLGEVQFTSVIDIAAHVEGVSPVGGIAVTAAARESLTFTDGFRSGPEVDGSETWLIDSLSANVGSKV